MSIQCPLCCVSLKPDHLPHCAREWLKFHRISQLKEKCPSIRVPRCPLFSNPEDRKRTFSQWQLKSCVDELVFNGFFYTGEGDIVCCFWCKGRIGYWTAEDDSLERHVKDWPECSLAWYACEEFCRKMPESFYHPTALPCHIKMIEQSHRINSFKDWTLEPFIRKKRPSKDNLVKCGFFWTQEDLFVRCFWCDLEINYRWFNSENALDDHLQMKPNCAFAQNVNISAEIKEDRLLCKICLTNEMEVVFLNCSHLACCKACSKKCTNCPICRKFIRETLRIYIS